MDLWAILQPNSALFLVMCGLKPKIGQNSAYFLNFSENELENPNNKFSNMKMGSKITICGSKLQNDKVLVIKSLKNWENTSNLCIFLTHRCSRSFIKSISNSLRHPLGIFNYQLCESVNFEHLNSPKLIN